MKILQEGELVQRIKDWIRQNQEQVHMVPVDITESTDLIASGVLDSMGFIDLMLFLETVTGDKIDLSEADPAEFTTINGLCKSILTKQLILGEAGT
jgi:acyl carrier protein